MNARYTNHEETGNLMFADYIQIVGTIAPNWPYSDIRRLATDCWSKCFDEEQTIAETRKFLSVDTRALKE